MLLTTVHIRTTYRLLRTADTATWLLGAQLVWTAIFMLTDLCSSGWTTYHKSINLLITAGSLVEKSVGLREDWQQITMPLDSEEIRLVLVNYAFRFCKNQDCSPRLNSAMIFEFTLFLAFINHFNKSINQSSSILLLIFNLLNFRTAKYATCQWQKVYVNCILEASVQLPKDCWSWTGLAEWVTWLSPGNRSSMSCSAALFSFSAIGLRELT